MDKEAVFETYLKIFSPICTKDLLIEWQKKTGGSRSTFFRIAKESVQLKRENGVCYYQDPRRYSVYREKSEEDPDKVEAIRMMQVFEKGTGKGFSDEEWACVLNQPDEKKMLEKAKALLRARSPLIRRYE